MELLSQVFGYLGTISAVLGFVLKKREHLLITQICANLFVSLSFIVLGISRISGGLICMIATVHTAVNYLFARRDKAPAKWATAVFFVLYLGASVYAWITAPQFSFPIDVFPFICAVLFIAGITLTNTLKLRLSFMVNDSLWILYDLLGNPFPVANFITHILEGISILYSIVRFNIIEKDHVSKD